MQQHYHQFESLVKVELRLIDFSATLRLWFVVFVHLMLLGLPVLGLVLESRLR